MKGFTRKASPVLQIKLQKPIAILGMGVSGQACLDLLLTAGVSRSDILTHDQKAASDVPHTQDLLRLRPKNLIVSPGFALRQDWIQQLVTQGAVLSSELEVASQFLTSEKVIGITGSVGKSTVTSLIGAGLEAARIPCFVGGNLGHPLASYVVSLLRGERSKAEIVVLELSSYQLENFQSLRAEASIITSLTANHMERYDSLSDYYETKFDLVKKTRGPKIFNASGLDLASYRQRFSGPNDLWTDRNDPALASLPWTQMKMVGSHNRDNLALAARLGQMLKWPESYTQGLLQFRGLTHRLENLGQYHGVLFLNDSKATTVASVLQAVDSIQDLVKTCTRAWLLIGGKDKNLPWPELARLKTLSNFQFLFFGECGEKARTDSTLSGHYESRLSGALDFLFPKLRPGELVLLSPGGTSLDEFKSFEERGNFFKNQIEKWSSAQDPHSTPG